MYCRLTLPRSAICSITSPCHAARLVWPACHTQRRAVLVSAVVKRIRKAAKVSDVPEAEASERTDEAPAAVVKRVRKAAKVADVPEAEASASTDDAPAAQPAAPVVPLAPEQAAGRRIKAGVVALHDVELRSAAPVAVAAPAVDLVKTQQAELAEYQASRSTETLEDRRNRRRGAIPDVVSGVKASVAAAAPAAPTTTAAATGTVAAPRKSLRKSSIVALTEAAGDPLLAAATKMDNATG